MGKVRGRRTRKHAGTPHYNAKLPDEIVASIWTLTEEGHSQRATAELLKLAPSTVSEELAKDPTRLEALRARQREDRARQWKRIEALGLDEVIGWLERSKKYRLAKRSPKELRFPMVPRFLHAAVRAADSATKTVQLLMGGVTERVGGDPRQSVDEMDGETLIQMAIELNQVEILPPRLRAAAKRKAKEQDAG